MLLHKMNSTLQSYTQQGRKQQPGSKKQQSIQHGMNYDNNIDQSFLKQISQIIHQQQVDGHNNNDQNNILNSSNVFEEEECQEKLQFQMINSYILDVDEQDQAKKGSFTKQIEFKDQFAEFLENHPKVGQQKKHIKSDGKKKILSLVVNEAEESQCNKELKNNCIDQKLFKKIQNRNENFFLEKNNNDGKNNVKNIRNQGIIKKPTHTYQQNEDSLILEQKIQSQKKNPSKKVGFKGSQNNPKVIINENTGQQKPSKSKKPKNRLQQQQNETITSKTSNKLLKSSKSLNISTLKSSVNIYRQKTNKNYICKFKNDRGGQMVYKQIPFNSERQQLKQIEIYNIIQRFSHINIVKVYGIQRSISINKPSLLSLIDYYPFNLKQYIDEQYLIPLKIKIIVFQIIKALNYLHRQGIYHRNISAQNILINQSLQVVLSNFSSIYHPQLKYKQYKYSRIIRPPQLILNAKYEEGSSCDIWQLGCLIFYMVTKKMPFQEYSDSNILLQMIKLMGLPEKEDLKAINFTNPKRFTFPSFHRQSLRKILKTEDPKLIEMLEKIFVYNPKKRATSIDLLKNEYFDDLRSQTMQKDINRLSKTLWKDLFYFQQNELNEEDRILIMPM